MSATECVLDLRASPTAYDMAASSGPEIGVLRSLAAMSLGARQSDSALSADPRRIKSADKLYALMDRQEWQGVLDHLDAADMPPGHIAYYRGVALSFMGQHTEALACFGSALETHPNPASVYAWVGAILTGLGRYAEAIRNYNRALKLDPNDFSTYHGKGMALLFNRVRVSSRLP